MQRPAIDPIIPQGSPATCGRPFASLGRFSRHDPCVQADGNATFDPWLSEVPCTLAREISVTAVAVALRFDNKISSSSKPLAARLLELEASPVPLETQQAVTSATPPGHATRVQCNIEH